MKTNFKKEPREYGIKGVTIKDMGTIELETDEQVTFVTKSGRELDFCQKDWGFYNAPSLNGRLKQFGFKVALTFNDDRRMFIHAVEEDKIDLFKEYIESQEAFFLCWLDEWLEPTY